VRNYKNWKQADRQRYRDDRIYQHFKRRDGATCYDDDYDDDYDDPPLYYPDYDLYYRHCLCENNVCA